MHAMLLIKYIIDLTNLGCYKAAFGIRKKDILYKTMLVSIELMRTNLPPRDNNLPF
jgi:hypothetical protein